MTSDRECIGNLYAENQQLLVEYRNLLGLGEQIKLGTVKPDQVAVDANSLSWSLDMTGEDAAETVPQND